MSKVVAFSLKIEGQSQTLAQLDAIEQKLKSVTLAIKAAQTAGSSGGAQVIGAGAAQAQVDNVTPQNTSKLKEYTLANEQLKIQASEARAALKLQAQAAQDLANNLDPESVIGMRHQISLLKDEYYKMGPAVRDSAEGVAQLNKILSLNVKVSGIEQATGDFRRNVGNYRDAIAGILPDLKNLQEQGVITQKDLIKVFENDQRQRVTALKAQIELLVAEFTKLRAAGDLSGAAISLEKLSRVTHELNQITSQTKQSGFSLQSLKDSVTSIGDGLTGGLITGGIFALTAGFVALGKTGVEKFSELERALIKIDTIVTQTGKSAGFTTTQLKIIGEQLGKQNNIETGAILDKVTAPLLKFQNLSGQVFTRAQQLIIDFSKATGKSLDESTTLIGKALNSPATAMRQLKELGIALNEQDAKRVKTLVGQNDIIAAQILLLDKAEHTFTGQGIAQAASELGQFEAISVRFKETLVGLGESIVHAGSAVLKLYDDISNATLFADASTKVLKKSFNDLNDKVSEGSGNIRASFDLLKDANIGDKAKLEIVDQLVAKYGDLINKYDLESAAIRAQHGDFVRLNQIQNELAANFKVKSAEKLEQLTKEKLLIQEVIHENEIARISSEIQAKKDDIKSGPVNLLSVPLLVKLELQKTSEQEKLKSIQDAVSDFDNTAKQNRKKIDIPAQINIIHTPEEVTGLVDKVIEDANAALQNKNTLSINIPGLKNIVSQFTGLSGIDFTKQSQQQISETVKLTDAAFRTIENSGKDLTTHLTDAQLAAIKKAQEEFDKLQARIADLQDKIRKNQIDLIKEEFQKQQESDLLANEIIVRKLNEEIVKLDKISNDKTLPNKLRDAAKQAAELIGVSIDAENKATEDKLAESQRKQLIAIEDFKNELIKQRDEIQGILSKIGISTAVSNLTTVQFKQSQELQPIRQKLVDASFNAITNAS